MADNKMNRKGFLKLLSVASVAPLISKIPFIGNGEIVSEQIPGTLEYTELYTPEYDLDFPLNHIEIDYQKPTYGSKTESTYQAGERITRAELVYVDDEGIVRKSSATNYFSGIALNDANVDEMVNVLRQAHFQL